MSEHDPFADEPAVPMPPEPITEQQERAAAAYIASGGDVAKTAEVAGVTPKVVKGMLQKPQVRAYLATFLDEAGATLESAAQVIADAQQAKETRLFAFNGRVTDTVELVDHKVRMDAAKLNLQARGQLKDGVNVNVNIYAELTDEALAQIAMGVARPEDFMAPGAGR